MLDGKGDGLRNEDKPSRNEETSSGTGSLIGKGNVPGSSGRESVSVELAERLDRTGSVDVSSWGCSGTGASGG